VLDEPKRLARKAVKCQNCTCDERSAFVHQIETNSVS